MTQPVAAANPAGIGVRRSSSPFVPRLGGAVGYRLLKWIGRPETDNGACSGEAYAGRSKLEALFGADFWPAIQGRTVLDFGCGGGQEVIELAAHGARRAIGLDIRARALAEGERAAIAAGVADRCAFTSRVDEPVDVIISVDAFEHIEDPADALQTMHTLLREEGRVFIVFGPPWRHPLGGHLFSVFPWAHLLFSERALIRWRSDFKTDGATRFGEVEGGLNQMTIARFEHLIAASPFTVERFEAVPIRRLERWSGVLPGTWAREYITSIVRCTLRAA
jgi:SAM-dependent methyltransferase